jgi:large subunit ribosomal protein L14
MIQQQTILKVSDNSGAKTVKCIKVLGGFKKEFAKIGDTIVVSIKNLRAKRRALTKVKKGSVYKALIIRTKTKEKQFNGDNFLFFENSAVILTPKKKLLGTKIFGVVPNKLRTTRFLKLISLSSGVVY